MTDDPYTVKQETDQPASESAGPAGVELRWAWIVAGITNLVAMGIMLPLAATPPGAVIFPLGRVVWMLLAGFVGFVVGIPLSIAAIRAERQRNRKLLAVVALVGCLSPVFVGHMTLNLLADMIGFTLD